MVTITKHDRHRVFQDGQSYDGERLALRTSWLNLHPRFCDNASRVDYKCVVNNQPSRLSSMRQIRKNEILSDTSLDCQLNGAPQVPHDFTRAILQLKNERHLGKCTWKARCKHDGRWISFFANIRSYLLRSVEKRNKKYNLHREGSSQTRRRIHACISNVPFVCGWNGVWIHHLRKDKDGNSYSPHHQRWWRAYLTWISLLLVLDASLLLIWHHDTSCRHLSIPTDTWLKAFSPCSTEPFPPFGTRIRTSPSHVSLSLVRRICNASTDCMDVWGGKGTSKFAYVQRT